MISMGKEPGWFPNSSGELQHWDGEKWGPTAPKADEIKEGLDEGEVGPEPASAHAQAQEDLRFVGYVGNEPVYAKTSFEDATGLPQVELTPTPDTTETPAEEKDSSTLLKVLVIVLCMALAFFVAPFLLFALIFLIKVVFAIVASVFSLFASVFLIPFGLF